MSANIEVYLPIKPVVQDVTASGSAAHLGTVPHSARGYALQAVGAPLFIGDASVTAANGFELLPGAAALIVRSSSLDGWYIADGGTVRIMRFTGGV